MYINCFVLYTGYFYNTTMARSRTERTIALSKYMAQKYHILKRTKCLYLEYHTLIERYFNLFQPVCFVAAKEK